MSKGQLTRERIIAGAAPLFNQRGFAGCSMQDLMEATGLEKGGLYRHFASKEELALEAFRYSLKQVLAARREDHKQVQGAIPRLKQLASAFVRIPSPIPGGCPLMNAAADADTSSKGVLRLAKQGVAAWKAEICGVLNEGLLNREIRADIDVRRTANAFIALLEGALMISRLEGTREAMVDAQRSIEDLLMTLVVKPA